MPRVLNRRRDVIPTGSVYVGRPSPYGNPWRSGIDGTREEVVARYEQWVKSIPGMVRKIQFELRGKDLVCWCAPKLCHADVLLRIANMPIEDLDLELQELLDDQTD